MDNPDIINEILSYTGRLPGRYARTSTSFAEAAEIANKYVLQDLDLRYPLWNLSISNIPENLQDTDAGYRIQSDIDDIIRYHLNRAALDDDWDSFQIIAQYHMQELQEARYKKSFIDLIYSAIRIAHVNEQLQISKKLYTQFRRITNLTSISQEVVDMYYGPINLEELEQYEFDLGFVPNHVRDYLLQNYDTQRRKLSAEQFATILRDVTGSTIVQEMRDSDDPSLQLRYQFLRYSHDLPYMDYEALAAVVYFGVELQEGTTNYLLEMLQHTRYFTADIVEALLEAYHDEEYTQPSLQIIPAVIISYLTPESPLYQKAIKIIGTLEFELLSADRKIAILQLAGLPVTIDSVQLYR